jgi:hypothetical protein
LKTSFDQLWRLDTSGRQPNNADRNSIAFSVVLNTFYFNIQNETSVKKIIIIIIVVVVVVVVVVIIIIIIIIIMFNYIDFIS